MWGTLSSHECTCLFRPVVNRGTPGSFLRTTRPIKLHFLRCTCSYTFCISDRYMESHYGGQKLPAIRLHHIRQCQYQHSTGRLVFVMIKFISFIIRCKLPYFLPPYHYPGDQACSTEAKRIAKRNIIGYAETPYTGTMTTILHLYNQAEYQKPKPQV